MYATPLIGGGRGSFGRGDDPPHRLSHALKAGEARACARHPTRAGQLAGQPTRPLIYSTSFTRETRLVRQLRRGKRLRPFPCSIAQSRGKRALIALPVSVRDDVRKPWLRDASRTDLLQELP